MEAPEENSLLADEERQRFLLQTVVSSPDERAQQEAFNELFGCYIGPLTRYFGYQFRLNAPDSEAAANDVMHRVWCAASSFEGKSKVSTWVRTIAYNTGVSVVRRSRSDIVLTDELDGEFEPHAALDLEDQMVARDGLERVINALPKREASIALLFGYYGMSHSEIAGILEMHPTTVRTSFLMAKRRLRTAKGLTNFAGCEE